MKIFQARNRRIAFPRRPLIMGILNINDDSFSGDGQLDLDWALERAAALIQAGADIVDVGGESARTNRAAIACEEEIRRVLPFVQRFGEAVERALPRDDEQVFPPLLSLNTWRTPVAEVLLESGGDLLNDMSALPDATHASLCARHGAALLIMHSQGAPKEPHRHVTYDDIMLALGDFFREKIALATSAGLAVESIVLDPGLDFAKQTEDNLRILRELERLTALGPPVLLPVSRKSTIGRVLGQPVAAERDPGTVACIVAGVRRGAAILRVHNVDAAWMTLRTLDAVNAGRWGVSGSGIPSP